ncbi:MAG TPA: YggT family protein [Solirubrobacteraceae bacterium]|jgi:uncharacterized protein YggT (Ycf19 family)
MSAQQPPYSQLAAVAPGERAPQDSKAAASAVVTLWVGKTLVWLVYCFASVAAILLLMAFLLQLTGANPSAPFAAWVYRSSDVLLQPFRSLYPTVKAHSGQSELNLSLVFAIFVYGIFAVVIEAIVRWFDRWLRRLRQAPASSPLDW